MKNKHGEMINKAIIIGGGASIRQELWNTPIADLPLWPTIKDEFTIGTLILLY